MAAVHLRKLGISRNQPEDRQGLFRNRRPGSGHHGYHNTLQNTAGNHSHTAISPPIQWEHQTRELEEYGSSFSALPTPQRLIPMENEQQEAEPSITLGRTWINFPEDMSQRDNLQKSYGNHQSMEYHQAVQTAGGEANHDKGESSHYPSYRRTAEP
ncbi:hypothetical protein O181_127022 [Austropuccinia psidii MF-1]|uniref:Uncharacterized protein n=1 Tax=Austropuccinia psidii MF-1 TaxID=1389203 RepID=A0A9Q3KUI5_9BASI|nr:hypothetical protein [Austropuccinia psidii MF-1]